MFLRVFAGVLVLVFMGMNQSPLALAGVVTYSGSLNFNLRMPPPQINTFGFGGPQSRFGPFSLAEGDAVASATTGVATRSTSGNRVGRSVSNVTVSGRAGPGRGASYAWSKGVLYSRLVNFSGHEGGGPGHTIDVTFDLDYSYQLATTIQGEGYVEASVELFARAKPEFGGDWTTYALDNVPLTIVGNDQASVTNQNRQFTIPLPENSVTLFEVQFRVDGMGITPEELPPVLPPPELLTVPEPTTGAAVGIGLALMGLVRRNANRNKKDSSGC
jgi:hypothetical protein